MKLYHGSQVLLKTPVFGFGRNDNDYGRGFYCTESVELAKEWACPILNNGYANEYEFDLASMKVLNLSDDEYNILNWLAILLSNRQVNINGNKIIARQGLDYVIDNFLPSTEEYDVISGYRADDRYFAFAKDFIENAISVKQLSEAMKAGNLGQQIVLKSQKAFDNIKFVGSEIAPCSVYYNKRKNRELEANESFKKIKMEVSADELFIRDIINQKVRNDDTRLR